MRSGSIRTIELAPPAVGEDEADAVRRVLHERELSPRGAHTSAFASELGERLRVPYVVPVSSGTAALHLALLAAGVRAGDLVVTVPFTFVAPINAIRYCGADPLFLDIEGRTLGLDPAALATFLSEECARSNAGLVHRRSGRRIAATLCIHVYGSACDLLGIAEVVAKHEVVLIEDAAEALGVSWKGACAGTVGRFGCFSFNANKIITTAGGGAVACHRREDRELVAHLANVARSHSASYLHDRIGFNYLMSNLAAAIGRVQLRRLDEIILSRHKLFAEHLSSPPTPGIFVCPPEVSSNYWMALLRVRAGAQLEACEYFARHGIETRPSWTCAHELAPFRDSWKHTLKCSELASDFVCIPNHQAMSAEDVSYLKKLAIDLPPAISSAGRNERA